VKNKTSFTIMEIMVTIVILALITAFAVPQYQKATQKARERDAAVQLISIHAANVLYESQTGSYLPAAGGGLNDMNTGLGLRIMANGLIYNYVRPFPNQFTTTAAWVDGNGGIIFRLRINDQPVSSSSPCCDAGSCLLYQNCP
jgi:type II secretory pathway pseudopilin PulG